MESSSRIIQFFTGLTDRLAEQPWFQQLKAKWDELDSQSRFYLKVAAAVIGFLAVLITVLSFVYSAYSLRREYAAKIDLLNLMQSANEEMRRLKETTSSSAASNAATASGPWTAYADQIATGSGLEKSSITVSQEKSGSSTDTVKEALFDITLKHVNIRQVVRYAYNLETGGRPVKLRNMTIDTKSDPTGYLDATLSVSGFTLVNK